MQFVRLVDNNRLGYKDMKAFCGFHHGCTMTKTCNEGKRTAQGRPAGALWHFLDTATTYATKKEHYDACYKNVPLHLRKDARRRMKLVVGSGDWFKAERDPKPGEDSEPEECP
jgi:hypothetical protein